MRSTFFLAATLAAIVSLSGSVCAGTSKVIKMQPGDDYVYNYDRSGGYTYKSTNYNATPNAASYYYDYSSGFGSSVVYNYTGMTFDISGLPADLTSAILSINILSIDCGYGVEVGCAKLVHNGVEIKRIGNEPLGWLNIDVTSQVLADMAAGNTSTCHLDYVANGYGSSGMSFSSAESGDYAPRLTVTAVPEPSSLLALASGAIGLGGYAARRRRS